MRQLRLFRFPNQRVVRRLRKRLNWQIFNSVCRSLMREYEGEIVSVIGSKLNETN